MNKKKKGFSKKPVITAVDLGSSKICVVIATINEDGELEVKGFGESVSAGIENGMIKDIRMTSDAIKRTIDNAEKDADLKAENIFVSISGKYIKSTNANSRLSVSDPMKTEPGEINQEHIDKVVKTAVELVLTQEGDKNQKLIHSLPQFYKVDDQDYIHNPINMSGYILTAHIHVVLADYNCIKNIHKCFDLIGYQVEQIVLAPLATCRSVVSDDEKKLGCVLVDIGGGTTDIAIYLENNIMLTSIKTVGGNNISYDIARQLETSRDAAEKLKVTYGDAYPNNQDYINELIEVPGIGGRPPVNKSLTLLCDIVHNRVKEVFDDTYRNITYLNYQDFIGAGVILTGGSAQMKNIDTLAEELFHMPVRMGFPYLKGLVGKTSKLTERKYATIVGMLYYAKDYCEVSVTEPKSSNNIDQKLKGFFKGLWDTMSDFF